MGSASGSFGLKPGDYFNKSALKVASRAAGGALGGVVGGLRRGFSAGRMRHRMNKQIKDERREKGLSTTRKDMRAERKDARKKFHSARDELRTARSQYNKGIITSDEFKEKKNKFVSASDAFGEAKRLDARKDAVSTGVKGFVSGATSGVVTGMKAKNVSGVFKQSFSETAKKDQASLNKSLSRMQTGASIGDVLSSKLSGSYSSVQRTENEIKNLKATIAEEQRLSGIELGVNKADEAAKSRFASLAEKGDLNVLSPNQRKEYMDYDNDVKIAEQALKKAVDEGKSGAALDVYKVALNNANIKKIKGQKSLLEFARGEYFKMLTTMSDAAIDAKIKSKDLDGPAINLIKAELTSIDNSKSNSKTYDEVMRKLQTSHAAAVADGDSVRKKQIEDAMNYYSGKTNELKEWAVFDIINSTLQGNASDRDRNVSEMQTNVSNMENNKNYKTQQSLANEKKN